MSSEVRLIDLPEESRLHDYVKAGDFIDCYQVRSDLKVRAAAEVIIQYPGWVRALMLVRGIVTAPFGLVNEAPKTRAAIGFFPIESETGSEIVAGFDDRHLNFRISIMSKDGFISLATWVRTNNLGGDLYLKSIMPFHVLICRNSLQRLARAR